MPSTQGNRKIKTPSTKSSNRDSVTESTAQYAQNSKHEIMGQTEKSKCHEPGGFRFNITYSCVSPIL